VQCFFAKVICPTQVHTCFTREVDAEDIENA